MPKLNDVWIRAEGGDGEKFIEKCTTSVTVDGVFTIQCPAELVDTAPAGGIIRASDNLFD